MCARGKWADSLYLISSVDSKRKLVADVAKTEEKTAEAAQAPASPEETPAPQEQAAPSPEQAPAKPAPKPPKEGNALISILTVLLVVVGIGELFLLGLFGFRFYQGRLALRQYESSRSGTQTDSAQAASMASYSGPWLKIENGQVVWRREDDLASGASGGTSVEVQIPTQGPDGEKILARPGVPIIRYRLAEEARLEALQRLGYIN